MGVGSVPEVCALGRERGGRRLFRLRRVELLGERGDHGRVELSSGTALELGERLLLLEPPAVDAVGGHRVVGVDDEDDPRAERDLLGREPIRVPGAVPALVVMEDPVGDGVDAEAVQHPEADLRMALEDEPLGAGQRAGLAEDLLGDRELAEVVQAAREPGKLDLLLVEAEARCDPCGELGDARQWLPV